MTMANCKMIEQDFHTAIIIIILSRHSSCVKILLGSACIIINFTMYKKKSMSMVQNPKFVFINGMYKWLGNVTEKNDT